MRNHFIFNGVNSLDMGIRIQSKSIYSAPKYDLSLLAIPGRDGDLISSNNRFPNVTVSYSCFVCANRISELSEKLTKIKGWLYTDPARYHILSDSYDAGFFRKAVFNNKLDITDQVSKFGVFTVSFSCQPYRLLETGQIKTTHNMSGFTLVNPYAFPSKPYIKVNGRGEGNLIIQTDSSNDIWHFTTLNGYTECDSELMNFYHDTTLKNNTVEGEGFPILRPGRNIISFDGAITSLEIIPRWRTL